MDCLYSIVFQGVCDLTPRTGRGFAEVRERDLWLQPWHWLRATAQQATFQVELDVPWPSILNPIADDAPMALHNEVRDANSPVLIKSRDQAPDVKQIN